MREVVYEDRPRLAAHAAGEIVGQPDEAKPFYYDPKKFSDPVVGPNMHQVNEWMIKPMTRELQPLPGVSYALGKNLPAVTTKQGFAFDRVGTGEVRVLGGACSEVLGGSNLAAMLKPGYDLEVRAYESLAANKPAEGVCC